MLLAAWDFGRYLTRSGRYAPGCPDSIMGAAYLERLPDSVARSLQPGDLVFAASYGWALSWPLMYFSGGEITHVAFCLGGGRVVHMTTGGAREAALDELAGTGKRLLPAQAGGPAITLERAKEVSRKVVEVFTRYGWSGVAVMGLVNLSGLRLRSFRWTWVADAWLLALGADWLLRDGRAGFSWLAATYTALVLFCRLHAAFFSLPGEGMLFNDWLFVVRRWKGGLLFDPEALRLQKEAAGRTSADAWRALPGAVFDRLRFATPVQQANDALIDAMIAIAMSKRGTHD